MPGAPSSFLAVRLDDRFRGFAQDLAEAARVEASILGADFDPMAPEDLHMTFHFMGDVTSKVRREVLVRFRDAVQRLAPAVPASTSFVVMRVTPFPPDKRNLLVLELTTSTELQAFHAGVVAASEAELGTDPAMNPSPWLPHVTLGKLRKPREAASTIDVPKVASVIATKLHAALAAYPGLVHAGGLELLAAPRHMHGIEWDTVGAP
jgi:2'-5' RNA ligase